MHLLRTLCCIQDQWTALHWAARNGHTEVVEALLKAQAVKQDRFTIDIIDNQTNVSSPMHVNCGPDCCVARDSMAEQLYCLLQ